MSKRVVILKREEPEDEWPEICQRAWNTPTPQEQGEPVCAVCGNPWAGALHPPCDG